MAVVKFDPLRELLEVVPAIAAVRKSQPLPRPIRESPNQVRRDRLLSGRRQKGDGSLGIGLDLVSCRLEVGDAVFQVRIVQAGDTALDRVVQPVSLKIA